MALTAMEPPRSAVVSEVLRWLQLDGPVLRSTPDAVLQVGGRGKGGASAAGRGGGRGGPVLQVGGVGGEGRCCR